MIWGFLSFIKLYSLSIKNSVGLFMQNTNLTTKCGIKKMTTNDKLSHIVDCNNK